MFTAKEVIEWHLASRGLQEDKVREHGKRDSAKTSNIRGFSGLNSEIENRRWKHG